MVHMFGWLLDELEDPFLVFPIQSVGISLSKSLEAADAKLVEALTHVPAARKYWSVEAEHFHDELGLLIGSTFVLGQVLITQSVSIVSQLQRAEDWPVDLPRGKGEWMRRGSPIQLTHGLSEVEIIDTAANYFKHHYEWPRDWYEPTCAIPRAAVTTVRKVKALGMVYGSRTDNLVAALDALGIRMHEAGSIARKIQLWREAIVAQIRELLSAA